MYRNVLDSSLILICCLLTFRLIFLLCGVEQFLAVSSILHNGFQKLLSFHFSKNKNATKTPNGNFYFLTYLNKKFVHYFESNGVHVLYNISNFHFSLQRSRKHRYTLSTIQYFLLCIRYKKRSWTSSIPQGAGLVEFNWEYCAFKSVKTCRLQYTVIVSNN